MHPPLHSMHREFCEVFNCLEPSYWRDHQVWERLAWCQPLLKHLDISSSELTCLNKRWVAVNLHKSDLSKMNSMNVFSCLKYYSIIYFTLWTLQTGIPTYAYVYPWPFKQIIYYSVSETWWACTPVHVRLIMNCVLLTPEGIRLHLGHSWNVKPVYFLCHM